MLLTLTIGISSMSIESLRLSITLPFCETILVLRKGYESIVFIMASFNLFASISLPNLMIDGMLY